MLKLVLYGFSVSYFSPNSAISVCQSFKRSLPYLFVHSIFIPLDTSLYYYMPTDGTSVAVVCVLRVLVLLLWIVVKIGSRKKYCALERRGQLCF